MKPMDQLKHTLSYALERMRFSYISQLKDGKPIVALRDLRIKMKMLENKLQQLK